MTSDQDQATDDAACWVDISPARIRDNLLSARAYLSPENRFCAVLKANAYGHGMENVLPVLMREGVDFIGITSNPEARAARALGFRGRILRLRPATLAEASAVRDLAVEEQVGSRAAAEELAQLAAQTGSPSPVHLVLNAGGMGRDGVELAHPDGADTCAQILGTAALNIVGIMTHFPSNTPDDLAAARARFATDVRAVRAHPGLARDEVLVHAGSSLTIMARATQGVDMVRCGAVLYGIVGPRDKFGTTMALRARVAGIGLFPKGATVGYDRTIVLARDSRLACVSIGYADGYRRCLGNRAQALLGGRKVPVLGKISMNSLIVDATDLPDTAIGDIATLFGAADGAEITGPEIEPHAETILADLFVDWGRSNPRRILDHASGPNPWP